MDSLANNSRVWVLNGYTDAALTLSGYEGRVVGQTLGRYLVRDRQGQVEVLDRSALLRLPHDWRCRRD